MKELREKLGQVFLLFAEILEYPTVSLYECLDECLTLLLGINREAAKLLKGFEGYLARVPLSQLEEVYTRSFPLRSSGDAHPGDPLLRGYDLEKFVAGLPGRSPVQGLSAGKEPPEHLAVVLRFLGEFSAREEEDERLRACVVPALERMLGGLEEGENPYRSVFQALLLALRKGRGGEGKKTFQVEDGPVLRPADSAAT